MAAPNTRRADSARPKRRRADADARQPAPAEAKRQIDILHQRQRRESANRVVKARLISKPWSP